MALERGEGYLPSPLFISSEITMPKTTVIAVRVSVETKAALRALAAEDRRALSNYVNKLLEDHVAEMKGEELEATS